MGLFRYQNPEEKRLNPENFMAMADLELKNFENNFIENLDTLRDKLQHLINEISIGRMDLESGVVSGYTNNLHDQITFWRGNLIRLQQELGRQPSLGLRSDLAYAKIRWYLKYLGPLSENWTWGLEHIQDLLDQAKDIKEFRY